MLIELGSVLNGVLWGKLAYGRQKLEDGVDRLGHEGTAMLMMAFALLIGTKQYFGAPIQCMANAEFPGDWMQYIEDLCLVHNTYTLPPHLAVPTLLDDRIHNEIGYYQWVPFILALQALAFLLPNTIWRQLQKCHDADLAAVVGRAMRGRLWRAQLRHDQLHKLALFTYDQLQGDDGGRRPSHRSLTLLYLLVKLAALLNVGVQFALINRFLGAADAPHSWLWGLEMLTTGMGGESALFPRVTMCDVTKLEVGNVHRITVQCVLMLNMLNEKIYLLLWFWLLTVALFMALGLAHCLLNAVFASWRLRRSLLQALGDGVKVDEQQLRNFVEHHLGCDAQLLLHFVRGHAGSLMARDLLLALWSVFNGPDTPREDEKLALCCKVPPLSSPPTSDLNEFLEFHYVPSPIPHSIANKPAAEVLCAPVLCYA